MINACIFDLDGVIVDTAKYHFIAWRKLANELGFDFSAAQNEQLKGVSRMKSLELILEWGNVTLTEEEKLEWANKKNEWYRSYILAMKTDEILDGVLPLLDELEAKGIKKSIGSASKNAPTILEQIGIIDRFDAIIDGNKVTKSKPDPEVFLKGAEAMGVAPADCIVFEDAEKGIEAAQRGGFWAIGIGSPEVLTKAHFVIPGFKDWNFQKITEQLAAHIG